MNHTEHTHRRLLRTVRLAWGASAGVSGLLAVAGCGAAFVAAFVLVDGAAGLPPWARVPLAGVGAVLMGAALWRFLLRHSPWFAGEERLAAHFEQCVEDLDNALINSVQLSRGVEEGVSGGMAQLYLADAATKLQAFSGWEAFDKAAVRASLLRWGGPIAAVVAAALLFPGQTNDALARLADPLTSRTEAGGLAIRVRPGDAQVAEGGRVQVHAVVEGGEVEQVVLEFEEASAEAPVRVAMAASDGHFEAAMGPIHAPRRYRVRAKPAAGGQGWALLDRLARRQAVSETYLVDVLTPPVIEELTLDYDLPAYTGVAALPEPEREGDIEAPQGTAVRIEGAADKALSEATVMVNGEAIPVEVDGRSFRAAFEVEQSGSYTVTLTDMAGCSTVDPVAHTIIALPDRPPETAITAPGGDLNVDRDAVVPVSFEARDDYGLDEAVLCTRRSGEETVHEQPLDVGGEAAAAAGTVPVDLAALGAKPGDVVQAWVRARDNAPEGGQTARSETVNLRVKGLPEDSPWAVAAADLAARVRGMHGTQKQLRENLESALAGVMASGLAPVSDSSGFRQGAEQQEALREQALDVMAQAAQDDVMADAVSSALTGLAAEEMPEAADGLYELARSKTEGQDAVASDVKRAQTAAEQTLNKLANQLERAADGGPPEPLPEDAPSSAAPWLEDEELAEAVEDTLEDFVEQQRAALEQAQALPDTPRSELAPEDHAAFEELAAFQEELGETLEDLISDLSELPEQDFSKPSLCDEFIEIFAEVELAEDALSLKNKLMAISAEQVGLELAEELVHDLPSWLSDVRDNLKWELEEPPEDYDVPMAELPEELTDLIGELIEKQADLADEVEDASSSWMDSIDAGAGWATMDGPISNMSAKGKTGNMLPNESEIGGRSGEGRSGRSHGEFVEKTATGKGGRQTPTRLTPDAYEEGVVEDSSTDPVSGATGSGKLSGAGGGGLPGPPPPEVQQELLGLASRQADIRAKAERAKFKLDVINVPVPGLDQAIRAMEHIETDLRSFRYDNTAAEQHVVVERMRDSHRTLDQQVRVRSEAPVMLSREHQQEVVEALDEDVAPGYQDMVAEYFRALAEAGR